MMTAKTTKETHAYCNVLGLVSIDRPYSSSLDTEEHAVHWKERGRLYVRQSEKEGQSSQLRE